MAKICKSKFYIAKDRNIFLQFGSFKNSIFAGNFMDRKVGETETEILMERKPEFAGFRSVSGHLILKYRQNYNIIAAERRA